MFNHSHIRHFSSVLVSLRDFQLMTQNSSKNIGSRQSRCIYVNDVITAAVYSLFVDVIHNFFIYYAFITLFYGE